MPNSLKARLKKLKYQGVLSQEDIDRIVILPKAEKVIKNATMMTSEEARAYFIDSNERIISVAKDENRYNYETRQIEDIFMRRTFEANELAIKALEQEDILGKIRAEIFEEKEWAYADFEQYKIDCLGADVEYVEDELPQDDFRYGMERCVEIIDKYRKWGG